MAIFEKSIPDKDWVEVVGPIFNSAKTIADEMSGALTDEDIGRQAESISKIVTVFPSLAEALRGISRPESSVAREVKKNLELALRDYVEGASQGQKLFRDMQQGLGERTQLDGVAGRAARGRFVFQLSLYQEIVAKAQRRLAAAGRYFSS